MFVLSSVLSAQFAVCVHQTTTVMLFSVCDKILLTVSFSAFTVFLNRFFIC